ncbi:hypothetical protein [Phytoactinopolyspora limicola]|uniref:hypothetical protein n=1 Tax=Phytoactinopolyspora limicola TaxID=2715536 RepID=UPI00140D38AD|nr:hypothetical protein [Phytoactinopolyspora limicola]
MSNKLRSRMAACVLAVVMTLGVGAVAAPSAGASSASGKAVAAATVTAGAVTGDVAPAMICPYVVTASKTRRYFHWDGGGYNGHFTKGQRINANPTMAPTNRLRTTVSYGNGNYWVDARHVKRTGDQCRA